MDCEDLRHISCTLLLVAACQTTAAEVAKTPPSTAHEKAVTAPSPAPKQAPLATVLLARLPDSEEGAAAAANGTLRVQDGCLVLEPQNGPALLLGVTNPGITWNEAAQQLEQADQKLALGARLTVGGMQARQSSVQALPWRTPLPTACASKPVWITSSVGPELPPMRQAR